MRFKNMSQSTDNDDVKWKELFLDPEQSNSFEKTHTISRYSLSAKCEKAKK
jgi:hypothetical protein